MSTALYRKYRPETFSQIQGQDAVVQTLKNQIRTGTVKHAYLFSGPRGTGKTSAAKILAKAVNCEKPVDGEPCGCCKACMMIKDQSNTDIIEIDAASNNGVDNIRGLIDEVMYKPQFGKRKVYIIDEVHMLSTSAFNALLKTLEEPPPNILFILATTEENKVPATVYSRCQRFRFKASEQTSTLNVIRNIAIKENIVYEEQALESIARLASGSLRDAISLLDQCISYTNGNVTMAQTNEILGEPDSSLINSFVTCLKARDVKQVINNLHNALHDGKDMSLLCNKLYEYYRDDYVYNNNISSSRNMKILAETIEKIKYARNNTAIEIAFIKMCVPEMEENYNGFNTRLKAIESEMQTLKDSMQSILHGAYKTPVKEPQKAVESNDNEDIIVMHYKPQPKVTIKYI